MTTEERARGTVEAFVRWGYVSAANIKPVEDGIYLAISAAVADEVIRLQGIVDGLAARVAAQSELLSKKAEGGGS